MARAATIEIAPAAPTDVATISGTLARAFQDDPVFTWLVPDDTRRRSLFPAVFRAFAEVYVDHEETYLAGEEGAGAALWAPAGCDPFAAARGEAFGERMATILGDDADRSSTISELFQEHRPDGPFFYLQLIGVVPGMQRRGIGGQLLTTVLDRCDVSGTPVYLEATSPDNRRLYERHGFETVDEVVLPDGPPVWPMWREPGTNATARR